MQDRHLCHLTCSFLHKLISYLSLGDYFLSQSRKQRNTKDPCFGNRLKLGSIFWRENACPTYKTSWCMLYNIHKKYKFTKQKFCMYCLVHILQLVGAHNPSAATKKVTWPPPPMLSSSSTQQTLLKTPLNDSHFIQPSYPKENEKRVQKI